MLPAHARDAAEWFATKGRPLVGQLERVAYTRGRVTACALLDDALSTLECRTHGSYDGGDHTVVVGEVLAVDVRDDDSDPLLHFRGRYLDGT